MNAAQNLPVSHSSPFQFNNLPIRTQVEENNLWFAAKDVCAALGIGWNGTTLSAIPDGWQSMRKFRTLRRGDQNIRSINEPAVYKLAFRSNKPEADAFTNWVASEVIPSIRKTGKYEAALPHGDTLTAAEQAQLQAIVQAKAGMVPADMQRKAFAEMWTRFNRHFRIARYAQLPPAKMGEAVEYLVGMEVKAAVAALPAAKERKTPPHYRSHAEVKASLGAIQNTLITNANILLSSLEDINNQVRKAFHNPERRGDLATHTDKVLDNFKSVLVRSRQSLEDQLNVCNDTLNGLIGLARILECPKQSGEPIIYGLRSF